MSTYKRNRMAHVVIFVSLLKHGGATDVTNFRCVVYFVWFMLDHSVASGDSFKPNLIDNAVFS